MNALVTTITKITTYLHLHFSNLNQYWPKLLVTTLIISLATPLTTSAEEITLAVVGDNDDSSGTANVASLIDSWPADFIITTGDNRYAGESFDDIAGQYYCAYLTDAGSGNFCNGGSSATNAFFPSLGNHDYTDGGGLNEYLNYFSLPGVGLPGSNSSNSERYYDFVAGPVHFFAIDSQGALTNSADMAAQQNWLQAQLAASTSSWQVVFFHHPPYSSGLNSASSAMRWPFAAWGADAVFSGHSHTYERIAANGIVYFVSGLGGRSISSFGTPIPGSQLRYNDNHGALRINTANDNLLFEFINIHGSIIDSFLLEGTSEPPPSDGVVDVRIASGGDDVEERQSDGYMYLNSSDLELGEDHGSNGDQNIGLRFRQLGIPQGATINGAYLEFTAEAANSVTTNVSILVQATDNASAFSANPYDLSNRPLTQTSIAWTISSWNRIGDTHRSPDITPLIQEVIDRPGWDPGNNMVLVIQGSGERSAEAYEGIPSAATVLHVEYDDAPPGNPLPEAAFTETIDRLEVSFTDTSNVSNGNINSWDWDFGDGQTSIQQHPVHNYSADGSYLVQLTVTDEQGETDSTSHVVTVEEYASPTAGFTQVINELEVAFTDTSSHSDGTITAWDWDFGDGQSSTQQHPQHSYAGSGSYLVTLTVTDSRGLTDSINQSVNAVSLPSIHVGDLDAKTRGKDRWTAKVIFKIHGENENKIEGVTVSGNWSNGTSSSCVTDSKGKCRISTKTTAVSINFTVTNLGGDYNYDPGDNHDPDNDSNGTTITINKGD